ncbi:MAG: HPr family phosphocarrier protein [Victivallales bacterium]|nr:HPr family phosphocarrier protein [Victivallales bacterium]
MVTKHTEVKNSRGIHLRPSGYIAQAFHDYPGTLRLSSPGKETVNGKSALSILSLGLTAGSEVIVTVEGDNEEEISQEVCRLLSAVYDYSHGDITIQQ